MKPLGPALAVVLLLLVAVLSAVVVRLAGQLRDRYASQLMAQVWPTGTATQPVITGPDRKSSGGVVLLFGDSRMAAWSGIVASNWTVVNAGQSGATTGQLRLRLPALLEEYRPARVVIQAGINDLKLIGVRPDLAGAVEAEAADNLSNIVAQCVARNCRVILLETWPAGRPEWRRRLVWNAQVAPAVEHLNARLRLLHAPARKVEVLDIFKRAGLAPEPGLYRDALHLKPAVYETLTPSLEAELAK